MSERAANIISRYEGRLNYELANKIVEVADNLNISPMMLAQEIDMESAGTFKADTQNPKSSATGLIQFMDDTKVSLLYQEAVSEHRRDPSAGWDEDIKRWTIPRGRKSPTKAQMKDARETFRNMDEVEQMDFVELYLKPYAGRINNEQDLAMAVFFPAAIGKPPSWSIADWYKRNRPDRYEAYISQNRARTVGDYMKTLRGRAESAKRKEAKRRAAKEKREWEEILAEESFDTLSSPQSYDVADEPQTQWAVEEWVETQGDQWQDLYSPSGDDPVTLTAIDTGEESTLPMTRRDILVAKGKVGGNRFIDTPMDQQPFFKENPEYLEAWRKVNSMSPGFARDAAEKVLVAREDAYYLSERASGAIQSAAAIAGQITESGPGALVEEIKYRATHGGESSPVWQPERSKLERSFEHFGQTLSAALEGKGYYANPRDVDEFYNARLAERVDDYMSQKTMWGRPGGFVLMGESGAETSSAPPDKERFSSRWEQLEDLRLQEASLPEAQREKLQEERLYWTNALLGGGVMEDIVRKAEDDAWNKFTVKPDVTSTSVTPWGKPPEQVVATE